MSTHRGLIAMNALQQDIYSLVDDIAQNAIDSQGMEYAAYDISNIDMDALVKLSELLNFQMQANYSWLTDYEEHTESLSMALRGNQEAQNTLYSVVAHLMVRHYSNQMKRLIDYRISELRQERMSSRIDQETGETIWSFK